MGLPISERHYIDFHGNRLFTTHSTFYGEFFRQIQTPEGLCIDCSQGKPFSDMMIELGFECDKMGLFHLYPNYEKLQYDVYEGWHEDDKGFYPHLIDHEERKRIEQKCLNVLARIQKGE